MVMMVIFNGEVKKSRPVGYGINHFSSATHFILGFLTSESYFLPREKIAFTNFNEEKE